MTFECWCILEKVIFEDGAEVVSVWGKKHMGKKRLTHLDEICTCPAFPSHSSSYKVTYSTGMSTFANKSCFLCIKVA